MSDTDVAQGQGSQSDIELFRDATDSPTLEQFENPNLPQPPPDKPVQQAERSERQRDEQGRFQKAEQEAPEQEGRIPPHRLREESEARRRAEQEISELRARIAAYEVNQTRPRQEPPKKIDIFDNPSEFVRQEMMPYLQQLEANHRLQMERQSTENAQQRYGHETVDNAYNALRGGMANSDPQAWAVYHSAMGSHDPYGVITRWFVDRKTLSEIGGDLEAYKKTIREQAMRDPDYQRQVYQAMRGQATTQVNRPVSTQQPLSNMSSSLPPSLSEIGTAGAEDFIHDASDEALFRAAVSARRRPK